MASIRKWMRSYPLIVALIALVIGVGVVQFGPITEGEIDSGLVRVVLSAIMILVVVLAGGASVLRLKPGTLGFSLKKGIYPLLFSLATSTVVVFSRYSSFQAGEIELVSNLPLFIFATAFFCFFVGLFEELLFRGICFDALAARLGSTKKGVIIAMIISALIFGAVHIWGTLISGVDITAGMILQMILKTLQTAMFGFLLAAIYYKTRSIWGVTIIHFLFDFLVEVANNMFISVSSSGYITADDTGGIQVMSYLFLFVLSLPLVFIALRIMKKTPLSGETIFTEAISSKNTLEKK